MRVISVMSSLVMAPRRSFFAANFALCMAQRRDAGFPLRGPLAAPARRDKISNEAAWHFQGQPRNTAEQTWTTSWKCGVFPERRDLSSGRERRFRSQASPRFAVGLSSSGRGREKRFMNVTDAGNLAEKVGEIGMLGVAGKLTAAVLANINEPLDARFLE